MFDTVDTIGGGISLYERVNDVTKNWHFQSGISYPNATIHQVSPPSRIYTVSVRIYGYLHSVL